MDEIMHGVKAWTDEEDDYLGKRWAEGASAGVIALEMNKRWPEREKSVRPFTRNSVLGRAHRIKCKAGHVVKPRKHVMHKPSREPSMPTMPTRKTAEHLPRQPSDERAITLPRVPTTTVETYIPPVHYLAKWTCQFIDDSGSMCGKDCRGPWCETHRKLCVKPPDPRPVRVPSTIGRKW